MLNNINKMNKNVIYLRLIVKNVFEVFKKYMYMYMILLVLINFWWY